MPGFSGKQRCLPPAPPQRKMRVDVFLGGLALILAGLLWLLYAEPSHSQVTTQELTAEALPFEPISHFNIGERGEKVRFLMFNVQNYFVEQEKNRSFKTLSPKSEESRETVVDVISHAKPEIVGLIEMGGPLALQDLQERLARRGLHYSHSRVLIRPGEERALAILSQHPVVQDASLANVPLQGERCMMRGLLDITIQTADNRQFRILGAHLKSRYNEQLSENADLRRAEAYALAQRIHDISQHEPNMPLLVFGDWNDCPADASVQIMLKGVSEASALKRLHPRDSRGENWTFHFRSGYEYCLYDYLFVNRALAVRMNKSQFCGIVDIPAAVKASDHRALWCDLR